MVYKTLDKMNSVMHPIAINIITSVRLLLFIYTPPLQEMAP